jgi:hypothetical protein
MSLELVFTDVEPDAIVQQLTFPTAELPYPEEAHTAPNFAVPAVMPLLPVRSPNAEAVIPMVAERYPVTASEETPPPYIAKMQRLLFCKICVTVM